MSQAHLIQPTTDTSLSPSTPSVQLSPWSTRGFVLGGLLMIVMYVLEIVFGIQHNRVIVPTDLGASTIATISGMCFASGLLLIALALAGTAWALRPRAPKLTVASLVFSIIAGFSAAINLALVSSRSAPIGELGGLAVVGNLAASFLLGIAVLHTRALPRSIGVTLLLVGLITFPCILLTIPMEAVLPEYVIADLPFPVWGAIFTGIGAALGARR